MRKICILLILFLFVTGTMKGYGQTEKFNKDSLTNRFVTQLSIFPQEKVYLHTDKGIYMAGDTLWFRSYIVDATLHRPLYDKYIYVELVSPLDSIVSRALIRPDNGVYHGYLSLARELPDGDYTLRAYSRYMLKNGSECIFRRPIRIVTVSWNKVKMKSLVQNNSKSSDLTFKFTVSDTLMSLSQATMSVNRQSDISLKLLEMKNGFMVEWGKKDWKGNTSWLLSMKDKDDNVYRRYLPISTRNEDYDMTFYPEGGYLLAGQACRIAFKVMGCTGNAADVQLDIVDESGEVVTSTRTFHEGMGSFILTPETGKSYIAKCVDEFGRRKEFKLPSVDMRALYGLRVDVQRENFRVSLLSVDEVPLEPLYLVAHVRGIVVASEEWKEPQKKYLFPKQHFPAGVVQFLLLNKDGKVLSERLAFSDSYLPTICNLTINGTLTQKREAVSININLLDADQRPLRGIYSVSVVDGKFAPADSCYNILSHLLLTSELKGSIQSPGFYFKQGSAIARNSLDLLMLTQGWRRYKLPEIIQGKYETPILEKHSEMAVQGRTVSAGGVLIKSSNEHLVSISGTGSLKGFQRITSTDKNGYFCFDSIAYVDGGGFHINAVQVKAKETGKIELFDREYPQNIPLYPQSPLEDDSICNVQKEDMEMITRLDNLHFMLQDVIVRAPIWGSRDYSKFTDREIVRYKDMRTLLKSQGLTISTLAEDAHVMQTRLKADETLAVRDTSLLNGYESDAVESNSSRSSQLVEDMVYYGDQQILLFVDDNFCKPDILVNWITPGDVENMVLVKDVDRNRANALLQGTLKWSEKFYLNTGRDLCQAYCRIPLNQKKIAVLNVTTKDNFDSRCLGWWSKYYDGIQQRNMRNTTFYPLGYQQPVEFYSPKYDTTAEKNGEIPDLRTTLYWSPRLVTDEQGNATFSFYTSDQPGNYFLNIEGIAENGELVHIIKALMPSD